MEKDYIVFRSTVSPKGWQRIKRIAQKYDVEKGESQRHIFDSRDDHVFIWGRNGWKEGFYHGFLAYDADDANVKLFQGRSDKCMTLTSAAEFLDPIFKENGE